MLSFFWLVYLNKVLLCFDLPTLSIEICNSHTTGMNHLKITFTCFLTTKLQVISIIFNVNKLYEFNTVFWFLIRNQNTVLPAVQSYVSEHYLNITHKFNICYQKIWGLSCKFY
jgi:hypothetical protein